jgi:hypothetical protein
MPGSFSRQLSAVTVEHDERHIFGPLQLADLSFSACTDVICPSLSCSTHPLSQIEETEVSLPAWRKHAGSVFAKFCFQFKWKYKGNIMSLQKSRECMQKSKVSWVQQK